MLYQRLGRENSPQAILCIFPLSFVPPLPFPSVLWNSCSTIRKSARYSLKISFTFLPSLKGGSLLRTLLLLWPSPVKAIFSLTLWTTGICFSLPLVDCRPFFLLPPSRKYQFRTLSHQHLQPLSLWLISPTDFPSLFEDFTISFILDLGSPWNRRGYLHAGG